MPSTSVANAVSVTVFFGYSSFKSVANSERISDCSQFCDMLLTNAESPSADDEDPFCALQTLCLVS